MGHGQEEFDKVAFLKKHMSYNDKIEYYSNELFGLLAAVKGVFEAEEMLLKVHTPVIVVGDIHGQVGITADLLMNFSIEICILTLPR